MAALNIPDDPFLEQRHAMVETQLHGRGIRDTRVLAAFERVPRHLFVSAYKQSEAYEDHPTVIGEGQTISQPYMVAAMVEALELQPADTVLEIGTGSGYQTAILAELAAEVFSVERFASLAESAQRVLASLNYANVVIQVGDGSLGLSSAAPFDAIIVSAAAPAVPPELTAQLKEGGRLAIPLGGREEQEFHLLHKRGGCIEYRPLFGCKFVPLIGRHGFGVSS
jgi:protein-L-isoaspartate(D-aspartate) O-methyltransferase